MRTRCCFFRGIPSRMLRRGKCVPFSGNIGSQRQMKSVRKVLGGEGGSLACTHPHSSGKRMEGLLCFSGLQQRNRGSNCLRREIALLRELFDRGDAVAHEADEDGLRGRLAINPVFDIVCRLLLEKKKIDVLTNSGFQFRTVISSHTFAVLITYLHFMREMLV